MLTLLVSVQVRRLRCHDDRFQVQLEPLPPRLKAAKTISQMQSLHGKVNNTSRKQGPDVRVETEGSCDTWLLVAAMPCGGSWRLSKITRACAISPIAAWPLINKLAI